MGKRENRKQKLTKHHRLPRVKGGTATYPQNNISYLRGDRHRLWHLLFGTESAESICWLINKFYIDPRYILEVRDDKVARKTNLRPVRDTRLDNTPIGSGDIVASNHHQWSFW